MDCDICGKPAVALAYVEGAQVNVCQKCLLLGKKAVEKSPQTYLERPLVDISPVENYSQVLHLAMERRHLTTAELAKKLMLNETVIKQMENGNRFAGEKIARILEKELSIVLIRKSEAQSEHYFSVSVATSSSNNFTLGDIATIKQKNTIKKNTIK